MLGAVDIQSIHCFAFLIGNKRLIGLPLYLQAGAIEDKNTDMIAKNYAFIHIQD